MQKHPSDKEHERKQAGFLHDDQLKACSEAAYKGAVAMTTPTTWSQSETPSTSSSLSPVKSCTGCNKQGKFKKKKSEKGLF